MARPKGSKNEKTVQQVEVPRCPDCGSTEALVLSTNTQEYGGVTGEGVEFNRIVKRRTQCQSCSRVWIVKAFEFEPPAPPEDRGDDFENNPAADDGF
jgi:DNA-directed RNA polymerase subunit RPC12/RpoP